MKKLNFISLVVALYILLFSYTAVSKFLDYELFVFQMKLAPLPLMPTIAPIMGILLPLVECALCVLLLTDRWQVLALKLSVILMTNFEIYIVAMLFTGKELPCTCGGIISTMGWKQHLLFNGFFIMIGLLAIYIHKYKVSHQPARRSKDFLRA
jgi:hypothetical protein